MSKKELNVVMCVYETKKYTLNNLSTFNAHLIIIMTNKAFDLNVIMAIFFYQSILPTHAVSLFPGQMT